MVAIPVVTSDGPPFQRDTRRPAQGQRIKQLQGASGLQPHGPDTRSLTNATRGTVLFQPGRHMTQARGQEPEAGIPVCAEDFNYSQGDSQPGHRRGFPKEPAAGQATTTRFRTTELQRKRTAKGRKKSLQDVKKALFIQLNNC